MSGGARRGSERPRAGYPGPQRATAKRSATALAVAIVLAGAATAAPAGAKARKPPNEWDRRVLEYVRFVEKARGLDFEHPIAVEFLSKDDFEARVRAEDDELTKDDIAEADRVSGQLHALGLIEDDVDLVEAGTDLAADSVVGWYDTETEEMVVRGKKVDDLEVRVTVVHELTHALQDQHFDLDKLADKAETSSATFAQDALIEGDATRIEQAYISSLPSKEQDAYFASGEEEVSEPENALPEGVPAVLDVFSSAPYVFGASFVYLLETLGSDEIDKAFRDPPVTDEHIIDPLSWSEEDAPDRVKAPELQSGEKKSGDADAFGAFSLYLMLAARVGTGPAFQAATGWGGDRYVGFSKGGRECIRARFKGERARDTDQIHAALLLWLDELPAGMATVTKADGVVELTSCETAGVVPPDLDTLDEAAFATLDNRILLTADIVRELDTSVRKARCAADRMVLDPDLGPIVQKLFFEGLTIDELPRDERDTFNGRFPEHLAECGI